MVKYMIDLLFSTKQPWVRIRMKKRFTRECSEGVAINLLSNKMIWIIGILAKGTFHDELS